MGDVVTIFNRKGQPLAEVDGAVTRSWRLERTIDTSKGQMSIAYNSEKVNSFTMRYGNIVLVESNDGLPNWAGIIWPRTHSQNGIIKLTLMSAEWLFAMRATDGKDVWNGSMATTFITLLHLANRYWPLPISPDPVISDDGRQLNNEWNAIVILDALNELANETNHFWWLEPERKSDGNLWFIPHLEKRTGRRFGQTLIENSNMGDVQLVEEPTDLANIITGYGRFDDWAFPIEYTGRNNQSIGKYGQIQAPEFFLNRSTVNGLIAPVEAALERRTPYLSLTATMTEKPYPRAGDQVFCNFAPIHGFLLVGRPDIIPMRCTSVDYSPDDNTPIITASEIVEIS